MNKKFINSLLERIKIQSSQKKFLFLIIVIIFPAFYFYFLGRARFVTTSNFVVRKSILENSEINLASFISGGSRGSIEDSRFLKLNLKSIDVYEELNKKYNLIDYYQKNSFDPFAGIKKDTKYSKKYEMFKKQINIKLDEKSGVLTLKTYAFSPLISYNLNLYLIKIAEEFVNKTNQDIIKNQLSFAQVEGINAKERVDEAFAALERYQQKAQIINIQPEILASSSLIAALEVELANKKIELATLKRKFIDSNAPEIIYLSDQVKELINQIKMEREATVSPEGKELNRKLSILSKLKANLDFSNELYKTTLTSIEQSRIDSLRKQRYITVLSKPFMPDRQNYNWRHKGFFTVASLLFIFLNFYYFSFFISEGHYD